MAHTNISISHFRNILIMKANLNNADTTVFVLSVYIFFSEINAVSVLLQGILIYKFIERNMLFAGIIAKIRGKKHDLYWTNPRKVVIFSAQR